MNTEELLALVDKAEDNGLEAEYVWDTPARTVLRGVWIDGNWVENEQIDQDREIDNEAADRYAGDNAEANAYYR